MTVLVGQPPDSGCPRRRKFQGNGAHAIN